MGFFKLFVQGLWVSSLFLIVLIIGNHFVPGRLSEIVFSPIGILIIFITVTADWIFSFFPVEKKPEKDEERLVP